MREAEGETRLDRKGSSGRREKVQSRARTVEKYRRKRRGEGMIKRAKIREGCLDAGR